MCCCHHLLNQCKKSTTKVVQDEKKRTRFWNTVLSKCNISETTNKSNSGLTNYPMPVNTSLPVYKSILPKSQNICVIHYYRRVHLHFKLDKFIGKTNKPFLIKFIFILKKSCLPATFRILSITPVMKKFFTMYFCSCIIMSVVLTLSGVFGRSKNDDDLNIFKRHQNI